MGDSFETSLVNSEPEESSEMHDESNVKSDSEKCESAAEKSEIEQSKPRRRCRRGKKRKQRKDSSAACETETHEEHEAGDSDRCVSDEDPKLDGFTDSVMVRPINVPKAPENYNTFIMDEHDECHLYMSFETPNPYVNMEELKDRNYAITEYNEDAAYTQIDYEYISPPDNDNAEYYNNDFEESYKNNRFDELVRLSREKLIEGIRELEMKLKDMSDELMKENPSPVLEKLQTELLELQEKHMDLKEYNSKLSQLVADSEAGSAPGESPANSQTLTDGFSPQSDLVSPSHTIETKCELVLSEQSPSKNWSLYSPVYDRRSRGVTPDIEDDSVLFSKTSDVLKVDNADVNANMESVAMEADCCLVQSSEIEVENSLNSSPEGGESQNFSRQIESGCVADPTTFESDLVHSPMEVTNSMSTLEELNSMAV